jgi:hypothetical protein
MKQEERKYYRILERKSLVRQKGGDIKMDSESLAIYIH